MAATAALAAKGLAALLLKLGSWVVPGGSDSWVVSRGGRIVSQDTEQVL